MAKAEIEEQGEASTDTGESSKYWDEAVAARGTDGRNTEASVEVPPKEVEVPDVEPEKPSEVPDSVPDADEEEATPDTGSEDDSEERVDGSETEPEDPWAGVPDVLREEYTELKAKADKLEHANRSANGRLGALQKKVDELSRKAEAQATAVDEKAESPVDPGDSIFKTPAWSKFREDFGEVATPIEDAIRLSYKDLHSRLQDTAKVSQDLQTHRNEQYMLEQANSLEESHPGWRNYIEENRETFDQFVEVNTAARKLFEPNKTHLTSAEDGAALIDLFRLHLDKMNPKPASTEAKPTTTQPRPLNPKRQKQLESAATVAPRSHPAPGRRSDDLPDPDEFDAAYKYFEAKAQTR